MCPTHSLGLYRNDNQLHSVLSSSRHRVRINNNMIQISQYNMSKFNVADSLVQGLGHAYQETGYQGRTFTDTWEQFWPDALPVATHRGTREIWTQVRLNHRATAAHSTILKPKIPHTYSLKVTCKQFRFS